MDSFVRGRLGGSTTLPSKSPSPSIILPGVGLKFSISVPRKKSFGYRELLKLMKL
jgi:hypothetical protein